MTQTLEATVAEAGVLIEEMDALRKTLPQPFSDLYGAGVEHGWRLALLGVLGGLQGAPEGSVMPSAALAAVVRNTLDEGLMKP